MEEQKTITALKVGGEVADNPNGLTVEQGQLTVKTAIFHDLRGQGLSFEEARRAAGLTKEEMPDLPDISGLG